MKVKVAAADGSVPQGVVSWDQGGACMSQVTQQRVPANGIVTMTAVYNYPQGSYSRNACFRPDSYDAYQGSQDYGFYDIGPTKTSTTVAMTPAGGARTGQRVKMTATVTSADGSRPDGTVYWMPTADCATGTPYAFDRVSGNGTAILATKFFASGGYATHGCFVPDDAEQYQASDGSAGSYLVTAPQGSPAAALLGVG